MLDMLMRVVLLCFIQVLPLAVVLVCVALVHAVAVVKFKRWLR
jgi:hypothetical protein